MSPILKLAAVVLAFSAAQASTNASLTTTGGWVVFAEEQWCLPYVNLGSQEGMTIQTCGAWAAASHLCNPHFIFIRYPALGQECLCAKSGDDCSLRIRQVDFIIFQCQTQPCASPTPTSTPSPTKSPPTSSTDGSNPVDQGCKDQCYVKTTDWYGKCKWTNCMNCTECEQLTPPPTSAPTAFTQTPTAPTLEPTTPTSTPTAPTPEPTAPTTAPTAPTIHSTAPAPEPTAPTSFPTSPTPEPTAPTALPTAPTLHSTAPTPEPTAPTSFPTSPTQEPTAPTASPTAPTQYPTAPTLEPTTPASTPTTPTPQPTAPTPQPTVPTSYPTPLSQPTAPTSYPTAPTLEPTTPTSDPTTPTPEPTAPTPQPTAPTPYPTAPTREPTAPTSTPTAPTPEPTVPAISPTVLTSYPTAPAPEPTAPTSFPTAPTPEPTVPTASPTAPTQYPTAPASPPPSLTLVLTAPTPAPTAPHTLAPTEAVAELGERVGAAIAAFEETERELLSDLPMMWDNGTAPRVVVKVAAGLAVAQRLSASQAIGDTVAMDVEDAAVQIDFPVAVLAGLPPDCAALVIAFDGDSLKTLGTNENDGSNDAPQIAVLAAMVLNIRSAEDGARLSISGLETPISFSIPLQPSNETQPPQCAFFNESSGEWSNAGVTTLRVQDGKLYCETTHLSLFGGLVLVKDAFEKVLDAALHCKSADHVLSEAALRNLMEIYRWIWRPATVWTFFMVSMYCMLIPWSCRRERIARARFHWTDDRWCVEVEDKHQIHHFKARSVLSKLADEVGLHEVLEARNSEENRRYESVFRKLWIIATARVAIIYVRANVGLDTMCTRICVREFTRTMTSAVHHHRRFNVRREEHHMFTNALHRADVSLQKRRFRLLRAMHAMFVSSHPWVKLMMFDCRVPAPIRALALATSVSASFMISAVYFRQGAMSSDSSPQCTMRIWQERLLWNCCVGLISIWFAFIPKVALQFCAQKHCVKVLKGDTSIWRNARRKWRLKEFILWVVFSVYNLYNISYCFLFIACVSEADARDWFVSGVASTTKSLIIAPIIGSVVSALLARVFATLKAGRARRAQRKAVGLDDLMVVYAVIVQKRWRGQIGRKLSAELRQSRSNLGTCSIQSHGYAARLREIGANAMSAVGRSFGIADFMHMASSKKVHAADSVAHKLTSASYVEESPNASDFVVHWVSSGGDEPSPTAADLVVRRTPPRGEGANANAAEFVVHEESATKIEASAEWSSGAGDTGATAVEAPWLLPDGSDIDNQDSTGGGADALIANELYWSPLVAEGWNPYEFDCSPLATAAELGPGGGEQSELGHDRDASVQSQAIPSAPTPMPGEKLCNFMSSRPVAGMEEFEEQSPFVSPPNMPVNLQREECKSDVVDPALLSTAVVPPSIYTTSIVERMGFNMGEGIADSRQGKDISVLNKPVSEGMWAQVLEKQQRLESLKKQLDQLHGDMNFFLAMCDGQDFDPATHMVQAKMVKLMKKECNRSRDRLKAALLNGLKPANEEEARRLHAQLVAEITKVEGSLEKSRQACDYLHSFLQGSDSKA